MSWTRADEKWVDEFEIWRSEQEERLRLEYETGAGPMTRCHYCGKKWPEGATRCPYGNCECGWPPPDAEGREDYPDATAPREEVTT